MLPKVVTVARDQNYKAKECASHVTIIICINLALTQQELLDHSPLAMLTVQTKGSGTCRIISH